MRRKFKSIIKLLCSKEYVLTTRDNNDRLSFDLKMNEEDIKRTSMFLYNFLTETGNALKEVNKIINP